MPRQPKYTKTNPHIKDRLVDKVRMMAKMCLPEVGKCLPEVKMCLPEVEMMFAGSGDGLAGSGDMVAGGGDVVEMDRKL